MRQKAGPGLPLHLPILYRKANSNSSGYSPFALASGLKGFMHGNFGQILDHSRALGFLGESMISLNRVNVRGQCSCCQWPRGGARIFEEICSVPLARNLWTPRWLHCIEDAAHPPVYLAACTSRAISAIIASVWAANCSAGGDTAAVATASRRIGTHSANCPP